MLKEFCALRAKIYSYLMGDDIKVKKAKGTKECVIKPELMLENYKDYLFNCVVILKSQQSFKSNHQKVYTEEVNKIALSSNDDERLQTFDRMETYPYGINTFKVCESEMMTVRGLFVENYADFSLYDQIILQRQDKRLSKV